MLESQPRIQSRSFSIVPTSHRNDREYRDSQTTVPGQISSSPDQHSPSSSFSSTPLLHSSSNTTISPPSVHSSSQNIENPQAVYLFILVAFSYMIPWTAVGSLIDYYTHHYGKNYYVYLNLAFYGVGYPVSLIQQRLDLYHDIIYGSQQTFQTRLYVSVSLSLVLLSLLPFLTGVSYILAIVGIGLTTWTSHGCASTLAGLIKFDSPILQQIGFVLPGLFSILMIYTFDLKGGDISLRKRIIFFACASGCVIPGLIAWYFLCHSNIATNKFENKVLLQPFLLCLSLSPSVLTSSLLLLPPFAGQEDESPDRTISSEGSKIQRFPSQLLCSQSFTCRLLLSRASSKFLS
jgi:hypothetical protein